MCGNLLGYRRYSLDAVNDLVVCRSKLTDDLGQVVHGLRLLDLRDDLDACATVIVKEGPYLFHILLGGYERSRNEVHIILDAEKKIKLGNLWASKAGNNFRYCLVYKKREVDGAYTKENFLEILKEL